MENATTIALSRLVAQSRAMDVTASNLANASTPGFRGERMIFSDFLVRQNGGAMASGDGALAYSADRATYRDRQPGALTHTGDPLDIAITGDGYFTVMTANGPRLTRAGHFGLSASGAIVDDGGNALLDTEGRPMQVGPTDAPLGISADGAVTGANGRLGKIGIVNPADPNLLKAEGSRLFSAVDTTVTPVAAPKLLQGATEDSNVQPTLELARMMTELREFQFVSQFVQGEADRQQGAIDKILTTRG